MTNNNQPGTGDGKRVANASGKPLPEHYRAPLAYLVGRLGESGACDQIGISRPTLARALGGLGLQKATIKLIAVALSGA
jgi:hypothetical protein